MNLLARATALTAALALAACATVTPVDLPAGGASLSGRLAVKVDADGVTPARSETAAFDLQGTAQAGRMLLSTPLGSALAEARWRPGSVLLVTPKGERHYEDLDALTRDVLGESVPVEALFDWLRGRPWPGAASTATTAPADPGFTQLGWTVSLAQFDRGLIVARRDRSPAVTVRASVER